MSIATEGILPSGTLPEAEDVIEFQNMLLLSPRNIDRATLTATGEVPTLPVTNLQTIQPARKFRVMDNEVSIYVAFATAISANALALVAHNFSDSGSIRLRAATLQADLDSDPELETDWASPWPNGLKPIAPDWANWLSLIQFENNSAYRYWRVDLFDDGPSQTYLEAGRLVLDRAWQPSTNFDFGGTPMAHDPRDAVAETDYGYTFTDRRTLSPPRIFKLQITSANQTEVLAGLQEIQRLAGLAGDLVCCLDPGDADNFHLLSMQGRFTKGGAFGAPALWDEDGPLWGAAIEMREFL